MHRNMNSIDWTEIQTIITVAKSGSLSAAARLLSVNHSTVLRRIQSFEKKHHVQVFIREHQGYRLSRHGHALLQDFDQIDQVMLSLQRRITDYDSELQGRLTLTTTENIFASFLKEPLFEFAKVFPRVELDLLISNQLVDMNLLEADIAIRPMGTMPEHFFGFNLFELQFFIYCPKEFVTEIESIDPFSWPYWVGYSGQLENARAGQTLKNRLKSKPIIYANSFDGVAAAANSGLGLALLPSFIGDEMDGLERVTLEPQESIFSTEVYAIAPEDLSVSRKVNALLNYLNVFFKLDEE